MNKQTRDEAIALEAKVDAYDTLVILAQLPWARRKYKIDFLEKLKKAFEKLANKA